MPKDVHKQCKRPSDRNVSPHDHHWSWLEQLPMILDRKKAQPRRQIKDALSTGITLKELGVGKCYGFTLERDSPFLLGDFTVTNGKLIS